MNGPTHAVYVVSVSNDVGTWGVFEDAWDAVDAVWRHEGFSSLALAGHSRDDHNNGLVQRFRFGGGQRGQIDVRRKLVTPTQSPDSSS